MTALQPGPIQSNRSLLQDEIREQPRTLARLLAAGWTEVVQAADRIRAFEPEWVTIAARGTSDNAARYAQYLLGAYNQLGVGLALPSLFTLYQSGPNLSRALTIGISQSGQSPDVVNVISEARRQGGVTLAITNDPDSPLAHAAACCIRLSAGQERSVAATKTYTTELLAVAMLSVALNMDEQRWLELQEVPAMVQQTLAFQSEVAGAAAGCRDADRFVVVGRGFNYCTAFEVALKMKEVCYVLADPYSVADLMHGPIAMIDQDFVALLVAPDGKAADNVAELMDKLAERGVRTLALTNRRDILERATYPLPMPRKVPEWLSPIAAVVPGQMFARSLAVAKGIDPDNPRGLSKVTLTR